MLAAGRSHDVPEEHFGPVEGRGILVVDRYKAYQAIDKVKSGLIVLAFCWAHVRRDFLTMARSWPDQEAWALDWVEQIGALYHLNDERLKVRDDAAAFAVADGALRAAVTAFGERGEAELRSSGPASGAAEGAGEPGQPLDGPDGVRRAPRGADGQQHGGAIGTRPGGGSEELLRQRVGVERPTGGDAVLAVPDAVPVGPEPAAVADGVPGSVCRSRGPRDRRTWTDSCRGTSARSKDGRGAVRMRSRRRTHRSPVAWSRSDEEFQSQTPRPAWDAAWDRVRAERKQAGLPNTYPLERRNLSGEEVTLSRGCRPLVTRDACPGRILLAEQQVLSVLS